MPGEKQTRTAYCYAAFTRGKANATEKTLTQFANESMRILQTGINVEKSYIDVPQIHLNKPHPGWDEMLSDAKRTGIKTLVIPSLPLLSPYILKVDQLLRKLKEQYDIEVFFVRENFFTETADVPKHLSMYFMVEQLMHPIRLNVSEK